MHLKPFRGSDLTGIGEHSISNLIMSRGDLVSFIEVDHQFSAPTEQKQRTRSSQCVRMIRTDTAQTMILGIVWSCIPYRTSNRTALQFSTFAFELWSELRRYQHCQDMVARAQGFYSCSLWHWSLIQIEMFKAIAPDKPAFFCDLTPVFDGPVARFPGCENKVGPHLTESYFCNCQQ
jgi:hypothetical protein